MRRRRPERWLPMVIMAAAVAAALGIAFAQAATAPGSPNRVLPLDDPYIYLVYARNTAAGHFLAYNPGDSASSGATSPLWALLLAVGFVFGVRGQGGVPWSLVLAAMCMAAFLCTFALVFRRAGGGLWGGLALAVGCTLYGRFAWGAYSGMEIPLTALGVAGLALALQTDDGLAAPLVGALLTVVRPDVGAAAVPAVLVWAAESRRTRNLWALLPAVAAAAYSLAWRLGTGEPAPNSAIVKTAFFTPGHHWAAMLQGLIPGLVAEVGFLGSVRAVPSLWGGVVLILAITGLTTRAGRALFTSVAAGLVLEALFFGQSVPFAQFGRYDLPYLVAAELTAAISLATALRGRRWPGWPLGLAAVVVTALTLPPWLATYARDSREIRGQQIAAATYIADHLPANAVIMLNDAGAMNYFGGRYTLDIEGLGTNGFALPMRSGTGSDYEALMDDLAAHPALRSRPLYFVVYRRWFPGIEAVFGNCPAAFTVDHPTILGGPTAVLCQAALPPAPDPGFRVADLAQDAADHYVASPSGPTWLLRLPDTDGTPRVASGRAVRGVERFDLTAVPGRSVRLEAITTELAPVALDLRVNGHDLGTWDWPASPGLWEHLSFVVPAADVTGPTLDVAMTGPQRLTSEYLAAG